MFDHLIHADWSLRPAGRICAEASREGQGWRIAAPEPVGDLDRYVDRLTADRLLAGFDFPIGLPARFGAGTGLPDFPAALARFGDGDWSDFFRVADHPTEISPRRPFYPNRPGGTGHAHLLAGLGVASITDLLRVCERAHITRSAASPLFWTMGAKQVGKAAITGWRDVLRPARRRGCALWPFDGDLTSLARQPRTVLVETYPAEAYGQIGLRFARTASKRRQSDRAAFAPDLHAWATRAGAAFTPDLAHTIAGGFGPSADGEDRFDALLGLLCMIDVVEGRRPDAPADVDRTWEGWILGQPGASSPGAPSPGAPNP